MNVIGLVVEYNPFHNGHKYQINKIKEMFKDSIIIAVMSSSFTQRGEVSILNKWEKTKISLEEGIDLVIELPYVYSCESADLFAYGAVNLLTNLHIDTFIFGSESNDIEKLKTLAKTELENKDFDLLVKEYMNLGNNYPTSLSLALKELTGLSVNSANDLLGISYIKEILKTNKNINIISIKRTNDFHDLKSNKPLVSATNIREKLKNNKNIKKYVPSTSYKYLKNINLNLIEEAYFKYLKYKINSSGLSLKNYLTVDEGIESRILKFINSSKTLDEFMNKIKTKRYTINKIRRMLTHILIDFSDNDVKNIRKLEYIRVLGFNENGKSYLRRIKKSTDLEILTIFKKGYNSLDFELKVTKIYSLLKNQPELIEKEYKNTPIIK